MLNEAFIDASASFGLPKNNDFNGISQTGAGKVQAFQKKGLRQNTSSAFLKPIIERSNLKVISGVLISLSIKKREPKGSLEMILLLIFFIKFNNLLLRYFVFIACG